MLQLVYISSASPTEAVDLDALVDQAQKNNKRDEVTGLLYTDGKRFLQALEGPRETVEDTFLRIIVDPRHRAVVLLHRRLITKREFGDWSMARRSVHEAPAHILAEIAELCRDAAPDVQGTFRGFAEVRRAA